MRKITANEEKDAAKVDEGINLGKNFESSEERGNTRKCPSKKDKQSTLEGVRNTSSQLECNVEQVTHSDQKERRYVLFELHIVLMVYKFF